MNDHIAAVHVLFIRCINSQTKIELTPKKNSSPLNSYLICQVEKWIQILEGGIGFSKSQLVAAADTPLLFMCLPALGDDTKCT